MFGYCCVAGGRRRRGGGVRVLRTITRLMAGVTRSTGHEILGLFAAAVVVELVLLQEKVTTSRPLIILSIGAVWTTGSCGPIL